MSSNPIVRTSGLPKYGVIGLSDEAGFAAQIGVAPPVANDILLQFSQGVDPAQVSAALQAVNGRQAELVRAGDGEAGPLLRVELPEGQDLQESVDLLAAQPGVVFAETNDFVNIASGEAGSDLAGLSVDEGQDDIHIEAVSNDPNYTGGKLWNMLGDTTAQKNAFGSQAGEAWTAGYIGNMKTVVGVVDTGIDYAHADLYLNIWLNQGEIPVSFKAQLKDIDADGLITFRDLNNTANSAFVADKNANGRIDAGDLLKDTRWANGNDQDANGYKDDLIGWDFVNNDNDPFDDNGHGTHVAGTIGGIGGNGVGVAGVNWDVQIVATKFLSAGGSGNVSNAVKSVDYFTTASLLAGSSQNFVATNNSWGGGGSSQAMLDAITRAAKADILFIAAAGNSARNNDVTASYPSNYDTKASAGYDAVIAVASLTSTGALSSFSSYGAKQVDIAAPGSSIYSTLPGSTYGSLSGTSMATPHVAGAAALYASANPNATAAQIKTAILATAEATTSLSGKVVTGGRLDVGDLLSGNVTPPPPVPTKTAIITAAIDDVGKTKGIILVGGTTDDTKPTLQGTISAALSADETLVVYHSGVKAGVAKVTGTNWTFTETDSLVAASWSFTARVESTFGTTGNYSASYDFIIDLGPNYIFGTAGNDSRSGTAGRDIISGLPSTGSYLGKGSIDRLSGGGSKDIFLLGDSRGVFYDDGLSNNAGRSDYAVVRDFQAGDQIQLSSKASGYFGMKVTLSGVSGLGIYVDSNGNKVFDSTDELIGQLVGATALNSADIVWA
ncbi:S8 family serine peptidase [Rhodovarius sp.]|uniref:S8 family peptidase n=1 Tax=Rhodovarius sp. TaxID=2972673 RepID=UPI0034A40082